MEWSRRLEKAKEAKAGEKGGGSWYETLVQGVEYMGMENDFAYSPDYKVLGKEAEYKVGNEKINVGWDLTKNEIAIEDTKRLGQHRQVIKIGKTESSVQVRSILVGEYGNIYQVSEFHPIDLGYAYLAYYLSNLIPAEEIIEVVVEGMKDLKKGMQLWIETFEEEEIQSRNRSSNEYNPQGKSRSSDEENVQRKGRSSDEYESQQESSSSIHNNEETPLYLPLRKEVTFFDALVDAYKIIRDPHKYTNLGKTRAEAYSSAIIKITLGE